jgi:hypothetical protein
LSVDKTRSPDDVSASQYVAGFMAAAAIFVGAAGIVYYPGRVASGAIVVSLIAAAIGGFQSRLAAFAVGFCTVCWVAGMILSVALERPVF